MTEKDTLLEGILRYNAMTADVSQKAWNHAREGLRLLHENRHEELRKAIADAAVPILTPEQTKLLHEVEAALEKLPPEIQEAIWDAAISHELFDIVLKQGVSDEEKAKELAAFFAGGEPESSWLRVRRILYPIVSGRVAAMESVCFFLSDSASDSGDANLAACLSILAIVVLAVDVAGDPDSQVTRAQGKSNSK